MPKAGKGGASRGEVFPTKDEQPPPAPPTPPCIPGTELSPGCWALLWHVACTIPGRIGAVVTFLISVRVPRLRELAARLAASASWVWNQISWFRGTRSQAQTSPAPKSEKWSPSLLRFPSAPHRE